MNERTNFQENYAGQETRTSSNRAFGFVFVVVFAVIAIWPVGGGDDIRIWAIAIAAFILLVAILRPSVLAPFNRVWTVFGLLLHRVTNPLIMGLIFFLAVTPTGLIMRLLSKDLLRLERDSNRSSYWIEREPPGPDPETMNRLF